jgi:excisionase family DNA binding protein
MRQSQNRSRVIAKCSHVPPFQNPQTTSAVPFNQRLACTIVEASEATGLGRTKLYELIGSGHLDTTTVGRRRLVLVRSLQKLIGIGEG